MCTFLIAFFCTIYYTYYENRKVEFYMFSNMSFGILSMIYILFLMWAFFRKSHIESVELKIFKKLLVTCFVGLFSEFILNITIIYFSIDTFFTVFLAKAFLIFFVVFPLFILGYVVTIAKGEDFYLKNSKKLSGNAGHFPPTLQGT